MRRYLWYLFFMRHARRNGGRTLCFECWEPLVLPLDQGYDDFRSHVQMMTTSLRVTILHSRCHYHASLERQLWLYRQWFKYFSGLPSDMWDVIEKHLIEEEGHFGL